MENENLKLNITATPTKVSGGVGNYLTTFQKTVWPEICRVFEAHDLTITAASGDGAGKNINLPAKVGAGV